MDIATGTGTWPYNQRWKLYPPSIVAFFQQQRWRTADSNNRCTHFSNMGHKTRMNNWQRNSSQQKQAFVNWFVSRRVQAPLILVRTHHYSLFTHLIKVRYRTTEFPGDCFQRGVLCHSTSTLCSNRLQFLNSRIVEPFFSSLANSSDHVAFRYPLKLITGTNSHSGAMKGVWAFKNWHSCPKCGVTLHSLCVYWRVLFLFTCLPCTLI